MSYGQKRKFKERQSRYSLEHQQPEFAWLAQHANPANRPEDALIIEAHEADLMNNQVSTALMLEPPEHSATSPGKEGRGSGLIRWEAEGLEEDIWVDRYDARLLLTSISEIPKTSDESISQRPTSPSGWSDLPSDSEETFFLSSTEIDDIRREKRRRLLDAAHSMRLRALEAAAGEDGEGEEEEVWGESDEEPEETQCVLMRRTAKHILASPNPTQLEARILANHGADRRFAFLRGRWKRVWLGMKKSAREEKTREEEEEAARKKTTSSAGLTGLTAYGDSDVEEDEEVSLPEKVEDQHLRYVSSDRSEEEAAKMEARRARAREWAAKRRAGRSAEAGL